MRYGLTEQTIQQINSVFEKHPVVKQAVLYGSRAKGNYKPGSDIDLSLFGEDISQREVNQILDELDALDLPYTMDLSVFRDITHAKFRDHIARVGVVFYQCSDESTSAPSREESGQDCCSDHGGRRVAATDQGDVVKTGWRSNKLGDVCSYLNRGIAPRYIESGGVCVLNQKCIREHRISFDLSRRHDAHAKKVLAERYIQPGDVLVNSTGTGTLGRVAQLRETPPERTTVDSHVTIVRPTQGKFYDDFFGYMMIFIENKIKEAGEGCGGQTELSRTTLTDTFFVKYPESINEQKRIVSILDEAFECIDTAIAKTEKNIANARELFESCLDRFFTDDNEGWTKKTVSELVDDKIMKKPSDGNHGEIHPRKADFVASGVPFVMASDLTDGEVDQVNCNFLSREHADKLRVGFAKDGDVLLSHKGTIGRVSLLVTRHDYVMLTPQVTYYRITNGEYLSNKYLYYYFMSPTFQREIREIAGKGSTRAYIGIKRQMDLHITYPLLTEQMKITSSLDVICEKTRSLEEPYKLKVSSMKELKQSLLQKAFSGELTPDFNPDALEH